MPNYNSPADFPMMTGVVKTFMSDGRDIALELPTESGPVQFRIDPGQIGMIVGKLFEAAAEAQRRRGQTPNLENIINDIRPMAATLNSNIRVANTIGQTGNSLVGIITEIGGVPFSGMLSPATALALAEQLQAAVHDQPAHTQRKPS